MDWQQPIALGIVAATVFLFGWSRWRRRKSFEKALTCGCATGRAGSKGPHIVVQSRRGEPQKIIFKQP